jgi:hypothetical protein
MLTRIRFSAPLFMALCFGLLLTACRTAQKFTESGDYDGAIEFCVQKLRGKSKKKTEYVQGLELAFQKAQARDLRIAENLAAANRPENWEKVNNMHRKIQDRQNLVAPLLPLVSKDGYRARFEFVSLKNWKQKAAKKPPNTCTTAPKTCYSRQIVATGWLPGTLIPPSRIWNAGILATTKIKTG